MQCPTCLTNNPVTRKLVTRQHHYTKYGRALFWAAMMVGAILLFGCSDSGGGGTTFVPIETPPTTPPPTTPEASVETCTLCHTDGKFAPISVAHPDPTGKDVTLDVTNLTNTGGFAQVTFNASTATGPVMDLTLDDVRFMIATLVPAGTQTGGYANTPNGTWGTWPTPYFERWAYERSGTDREGIPYPNGAFNASDAANGNYTYTFVTGFGSDEARAEAPDYNEADTQRLVITASGRNDANGNAITNNSVGFLDFVTPAGGGSVATLVSQRMFVTADTCKKCHSGEFVEAAHADTYLDTRTCVVCHSPLGHYGEIMQRDNAYLPLLIHQIHAAIDNPAFEGRVDVPFGAVTFPQDVEKCVICHNNDSGEAQGTGDMVDNWKNHPTAEVCGSCHTNVDFATGVNHDNVGPQENKDCQVCHKPSGTSFAPSVTAAHDTTPTGVNVPEFDVALTITDPINGIYYTAGEAPEVRVTLTNHADGSAVDPAVYTTPQGDAGVTGGGLNVASVYVYGPRAKSVPVLATGTITDPAFDSAAGEPPTQDHDLFLGGTDPRVTTDGSGFGYRLLPIPADIKAGTYMVRVRIGDYGRVGTGDYHIESIDFKNIQIGTDTVEAKVAGDACINCHGTGTAPFHDERHAVVFDTDQCLACHDQSGNFAVPIANRVHAVHDANPDGDIYVFSRGGDPSSRDWSVVTYPQDILTCVTCHNSGDTTYKTLPYMMPCAGCHVGEQLDPDGLVLTHMRNEGGPF